MPAEFERLVSRLEGVEGVKNPYALAHYIQNKGYTMSPELRAELERKHAERMAAKAPKKTRAPKKAKKRKAKKGAKKVGIRTMKELDLVLKMRKHGKPSVKRFRASY